MTEIKIEKVENVFTEWNRQIWTSVNVEINDRVTVNIFRSVYTQLISQVQFKIWT